jgi:hypothetical protein
MNWVLLIRIGTALMFASAMARFIWRVEWFDVLRWGVPSFHVLAVYAVYVSVAGAIGWFLAGPPAELIAGWIARTGARTRRLSVTRGPFAGVGA